MLRLSVFVLALVSCQAVFAEVRESEANKPVKNRPVDPFTDPAFRAEKMKTVEGRALVAEHDRVAQERQDAIGKKPGAGSGSTVLGGESSTTTNSTAPGEHQVFGAPAKVKSAGRGGKTGAANSHGGAVAPSEGSGRASSEKAPEVSAKEITDGYEKSSLDATTRDAVVQSFNEKVKEFAGDQKALDGLFMLHQMALTELHGKGEMTPAESKEFMNALVKRLGEKMDPETLETARKLSCSGGEDCGTGTTGKACSRFSAFQKVTAGLAASLLPVAWHAFMSADEHNGAATFTFNDPSTDKTVSLTANGLDKPVSGPVAEPKI